MGNAAPATSGAVSSGSLEWAAESLSTTGYGYDSHWNHPLMVLLVMAVQFLGVFLVFLIFPIYLIPFLEERVETRLPKQAEAGLANHAVLYRYGPAVETLLVELAGAGVPSLVLEPDEGLARRLFDHGQHFRCNEASRHQGRQGA